MHVAASSPLAVRPDDIPAEVIERERAVALDKVRNDGKPEHLWEKIVDGMMKKFYQENTLLEQSFVVNPDITVQQRVQEVAVTTGENIVVRRFMRYAIGE